MKLIDDLTSKDIKLPADKSFNVYLLLAIFFGHWGVHNFWAGNTDKAKAQLIVCLIGCCLCTSWISWITAIMDVLTVKESLKANS